MTLCRFYQQGYCKFGNSCKFDHPGAGGPQQSNRFGALGGGGNNNNNNNAGNLRGLEKYNIKTDAIESDLSTDPPTWILSAYAPGRDAPDQLFGGFPREQSFEEMRLHYMKGKAEGNEQKALAEAQELYQNAQQQIQNALRNVNEAARYLLDGENRHPNRLDICREGTQGAPFGEFLVGKRSNSATSQQNGNPFATNNSAAPSAFGSGNSAQTSSAFGQPSALGQKPNPFGAPAFGQPAQPASGFGQPAQPAPGFGQPSQPNPFGQPSEPSSGFGQATPNQSPFGQKAETPSAFGQPAQTTPAFGQPSQPTSAFGQSSDLGAKPSPFGAPAFGQASQPISQGQAFGQPAQLGQKTNPFGGGANSGPSPFTTAGGNDNQAANNPFGSAPSGNQGAQPSNPFGSNQSNNQTNNAVPFGQPAPANPFGSGGQPPASSGNNPFGSGGQQASAGQPNPFGAPSNPTPAANPFGGAAQAVQQPPKPPANPYAPDSTKQHPPLDSYVSKNMDGTLAAFKGKAVTYKDGTPGVRAFDGTWTRIWFPDGPPSYYKDTELPLLEYDDKSKSQWEAFARTGTFADGLMPALPPLREYTHWDF